MKNLSLISLENESISKSEEYFMKDYNLELLNDQYGESIEEALCECMRVEAEDDSYVSIEGNGIYDLSDDKDIDRRIKRDQEWLNDGSADIDKFSELEQQAENYFKGPRKVFVPVEDEMKEEYVTGYIQFNAGVKFDQLGQAEIMWRSYGQKIILDMDRIHDPEFIIKYVESYGVEFNDMVRVVFYGLPLEKIVGSRIYKEGEKKELTPLSSDCEQIMLAIPDYVDCSKYDKSIFQAIDGIIKKEVMYGSDLGLDKVTRRYWEDMWARVEELKVIEREERESYAILQFQRKSVEKRNQFDDHFKDAREFICSINGGTGKIADILNKDARFIAQIIYLTEKKGERISNPAVYFQLKALAKKKKQEESSHLLENNPTVTLINNINNGDHVDVHLLDYLELKAIFEVLWGGTGLRIQPAKKDIYFKLKERYQYLQGLDQKLVA